MAQLYLRPPSEADSFIVQVMHGCPYNKCTFCNAYKDVTCEIFPLEQIIAGIEKDSQELGPKFLPFLTSLYLEGGDPMVLPAEHLLQIMRKAAECFPHLERTAFYATATAVLKKTTAELSCLAKAGLKRVYVGLESGSETILRAIKKGCGRKELIEAGLKLAAAGIEYDVSMMLGIGGLSLSDEHALETASLLDAAKPVCVRIRTFTPTYGTVLGADYIDGRFVLMNAHEILHEQKLMIENITSPMQLLSDHLLNFAVYNAYLPSATSELLDIIDSYLRLPLESFRPLGITSERV